MSAALAAVDASPALAEGYERFMNGLRGAFSTIIDGGKKAGEPMTWAAHPAGRLVNHA